MNYTCIIMYQPQLRYGCSRSLHTQRTPQPSCDAVFTSSPSTPQDAADVNVSHLSEVGLFGIRQVVRNRTETPTRFILHRVSPGFSTESLEQRGRAAFSTESVAATSSRSPTPSCRCSRAPVPPGGTSPSEHREEITQTGELGTFLFQT